MEEFAHHFLCLFSLQQSEAAVVVRTSFPAGGSLLAQSFH